MDKDTVPTTGSDLLYTALCDSGEEKFGLPVLYGSEVSEVPSCEAALAILAEYGFTEKDSFAIVERSQDDIRGGRTVYESSALRARIDAIAAFPVSLAALYRALQKTARAVKVKTWQLGEEGIVTLRIKEANLEELHNSCYWAKTCSKEVLLTASAEVTWTPGSGKAETFYPLVYVTANGSRRRKAFDDMLVYQGITALAESWARLRKLSWRNHPLDEFLDAIADLTCRIDAPDCTCLIPESYQEAARAFVSPPKKAGEGACSLNVIDAENYQESRHDDYWTDRHDTAYQHDDPAALERIAAHLGVKEWFIRDATERVLKMGAASLSRWEARRNDDETVARHVKLDRYLRSIPGRTIALEPVNKKPLIVHITPTGAALTPWGVKPCARIVIEWNNKEMCDVEGHDVAHAIDVAYETYKKRAGKRAVSAYLWQQTLRDDIDGFIDWLDEPLVLVDEYLDNDLQFQERCAQLHRGLAELLKWTDIDFVNHDESGVHFVGCSAANEGFKGEILALMNRKYCKEYDPGLGCYDAVFGDCLCGMIRWLADNAGVPVALELADAA